MNIFRLQLMVELLREMEEATPQVEVVGTVSTGSRWNNNERTFEVTRTIDSFDLESWTNAIGDNAHDSAHACGYTACAVGHAMLDVRFNALGLIQMNGIPLYEGESNWQAVEKFFEIDGLTAQAMFSDDHYDHSGVTPLEVAKRVQELIMIGEDDFQDKYPEHDYDY